MVLTSLVGSPRPVIAKTYTPIELGDPDADTAPKTGPSKGNTSNSREFTQALPDAQRGRSTVGLVSGTLFEFTLGHIRFLVLSTAEGYLPIISP